MEETGCEVICGAPTTLAVKGLVKVKKFRKSEVGQIEKTEGTEFLNAGEAHKAVF